MPNYAQSKIYKITSPNTDLMYIGSTAQAKLCQRMSVHRSKSNQCTSRQIIACGGAKIELIEAYPCNSRDELHAREAFHIKANVCVNQKAPGMTPPPPYNCKICDKACYDGEAKHVKSRLHQQRAYRVANCTICHQPFGDYCKLHLHMLESGHKSEINIPVANPEDIADGCYDFDISYYTRIRIEDPTRYENMYPHYSVVRPHVVPLPPIGW